MRRHVVATLMIAVATVGLVANDPPPADEGTATTECQQTLHFFLLTETSPVLWVGEDIDGECHGSWLHALSLASGDAHLASMLTREFGEWEWIKSVEANLRIEPVLELGQIEDRWQAEAQNWHISLPPERQDLMASFREYLVEGCGARSWTSEDEGSRIVQPALYGADADLLYAYDRGLYVNYRISAAFYFPTYEWLLVITDQEVLDIGYDTMHGFLVYRITTES